MKKYGFILAAAILIVGTAGCGQTNTTITNTEAVQNSTNSVPNKAAYSPNLEQLMTKIKNQFTTVQETKIYTENTDPNGFLGKAGYYTAGAAFWDTRSGYSDDFATTKGMWGAEAGGSIEVYANESDAKKRVDYLTGFVGNPLTDPGAFKQVGNVVVRASSELSKSEQDELLNYLESEIK